MGIGNRSPKSYRSQPGSFHRHLVNKPFSSVTGSTTLGVGVPTITVFYMLPVRRPTRETVPPVARPDPEYAPLLPGRAVPSPPRIARRFPCSSAATHLPPPPPRTFYGPAH